MKNMHKLLAMILACFFGFGSAMAAALRQAQDERENVVVEDVILDDVVVSPFEFNVCDWHGRFFGRLNAPDIFYGNNVKLLNNNNKFDERLYARHTLDLGLELFTGQECFGYDVAAFKFVLRNKGIWGDRDSIASTTEVETSFLEFSNKAHPHSIPRHIFWARELWFQFAWNEPLGLGFTHPHFLRFGAFPFQLGRGISFGSNYGTGPEVITFFDDGTVDQYAFGFQLFGDLVQDRLSYDLYLALLENKSATDKKTKEVIFTQAFGADKPNPLGIRGFGKINVLLATRLNWTAWDNCHAGKLTLEPYAMYNDDPEQKIEFIGDASSKLGTLGFAGEWKKGCFEVGFEFAKNLGRQKARGWDRNIIEIQNRVGALKFVNSHVLTAIDPLDTSAVGVDLNPFKVAHDPNGVVGAQVQTIIQGSSKAADQNGLLIGDVSGFGAIVDAPTPVAPATAGELYNTVDRFRAPYENSYNGWMAIADATAWLCEDELSLSITAGAASGDDNPNQNLTDPNSSAVDGQFDGFLGLQQSYTGKRVRSAFVLGSAGKLARPLSAPEADEVRDQFATTVNAFTNLALAGIGMKWEPNNYCYRFALNPNLILYWEEHASKKFDAATGLSSATERAARFLGAEVNLFFDVDLLRNLMFTFGTSLFVPGEHFNDVKGLPIKSGELLGNDVAYTINASFVYSF